MLRRLTRSEDEGSDAGERLGEPHEGMLKKDGGGETLVNIDLETLVEKVNKDRRQLLSVLNVRLAVCRYQV